MVDLEAIRRDYTAAGLTEEGAGTDPFKLFESWMAEALKYCKLDPTAMTLSTVSANKPSSRIVLLKKFDLQGLIFYTNYESRKGNEIAANPNGSILFFWPELERQIRVEGTIEKTTREESEAYFKQRPLDSRIGAIASKQSTEIPNRSFLESKLSDLKKQFGVNPPIPDYWGGYRLIPVSFEFWQGRASRLHDRITFAKEGSSWKRRRLSP